jgi:biopolymer transport protein ExbD
MKIKRKSRKGFSFAESGTLSDLAFLLIIFFMVIAVFNINEGFILGLPQKDSVKIVNVGDIIRVTLDRDNQLFYKDNRYSLTEIENLTKECLDVRPNLTFLLKVHPEARYQDVVNVVNTIRKLDVDNFSFSLWETEE